MASRGKIAARKRLNARMRIYANCRRNADAPVAGATTIEDFARDLLYVPLQREINQRRHSKDIKTVFGS